MLKAYSFIILMCFLTNAYAGACETHTRRKVDLRNPLKTICVYEPTTVGYTHDSDDVSFMDFTLSLRYQLFPYDLTKDLEKFQKGLGYNSALYFSFTGRFAQYIGTRDSSPVIPKRFNPKLFFRHWLDNGDVSKGPHDPNHITSSYLDVGYAHDSNGQAIHTNSQYDQAYSDAQKFNQNTDFVNDRISRGWDDVEFTYKRERIISNFKISTFDNASADLSNYFQFRYFLRRGLLQGRAEDYDPTIHIDPQGKPRRRVDGVSEAIKGIITVRNNKTNKDTYYKYFISIDTGYSHFLSYKTYRLELSRKIWDLPLTIWYRSGYNSDLAQFYKKVDSYGINLDIGSF